MVFKWSVAMAVILAAALLAAGCRGMRSSPPGCEDSSSLGTRTTHTIWVTVARDSGKMVAKVSCENLEVHDDGNSHNIRWVIDPQQRKDWKFANFTDPKNPNFDLKFVNPPTDASKQFVIDHQDLGRDFMISVRDLLDEDYAHQDYYQYPYLLQVHGPGGQTLAVDPAITNHGR